MSSSALYFALYKGKYLRGNYCFPECQNYRGAKKNCTTREEKLDAAGVQKAVKGVKSPSHAKFLLRDVGEK